MGEPEAPGTPFIIFSQGPYTAPLYPQGVVVYSPGQGPSQSILMVP